MKGIVRFHYLKEDDKMCQGPCYMTEDFVNVVDLYNFLKESKAECQFNEFEYLETSEEWGDVHGPFFVKDYIVTFETEESVWCIDVYLE